MYLFNFHVKMTEYFTKNQRAELFAALYNSLLLNF